MTTSMTDTQSLKLGYPFLSFTTVFALFNDDTILFTYLCFFFCLLSICLCSSAYRIHPIRASFITYLMTAVSSVIV